MNATVYQCCRREMLKKLEALHEIRDLSSCDPRFINELPHELHYKLPLLDREINRLRHPDQNLLN
jgi:hypothetical protein